MDFHRKLSRERLPPGKTSLSQIGILWAENEGKKQQPSSSVVISKDGFLPLVFSKVGTDTAKDMKN